MVNIWWFLLCGEYLVYRSSWISLADIHRNSDIHQNYGEYQPYLPFSVDVSRVFRDCSLKKQQVFLNFEIFVLGK